MRKRASSRSLRAVVTSIFAVLACLVLAHPENAAAQSRRFSQIGFDRPTDEEPALPNIEDFHPTASRARLDEVAELHAPQSLLVPLLKGVESDRGNSSSVTSAQSWDARIGFSCELMKGDTEECRSVSALKEVLHRFTGSDDFFNSQCQLTCNSPTDSAVLRDLTLKDGAIKLRKIQSADSCHFQISKPKAGSWKVGQILRADCTCVPTACLAR